MPTVTSPAVVRSLRRLPALPLSVLLGVLPVLLLLLLGPQTALAGGTVTHCGNDTEFAVLLAGGGNIVFDCGPNPVTITVAAQRLIVLPTTVDGGGLVTLDGANATRFFSVTAVGSLGLSNIRLYHGQVISDGGGAVFNLGTLTLQNVIVLSNTATGDNSDAVGGAGGGLYNAASGRLRVHDSALLDNVSEADAGGAGIFSHGALTVTGSLFRGNNALGEGDGGGIQTGDGTALILDSTFVSNTAGFGAAIDNDGADELTLINSTLAYNLGIKDGGAIDIDSGGVQTYISDTFAYNRSPAGWGGAIWNDSHLTIRDSTFVGNVAGVVISNTDQGGGAIYNADGPLTIVNSTLYNNLADKGGGIISSDPLTIVNSTLVSNTAVVSGTGGNLYVDASFVTLKNTLIAYGGPDNCFVETGVITSFGHNLESADTCGLAASGDLTGTNPLLGPLGVHGGPTLTMDLLPGSPAINHGDNLGCPSFDQRGAVRPFGPACDIGAYEFGAIISRIRLPFIMR